MASLIHPGRTITAVQLTAIIVTLIAVPIGCGLLLSFFTQRIPEEHLPARVRLDTMWVTPRGNTQDPRMVPCISVMNPTQDAWKNLSVGINEQFYSGEPAGVPAGQSVSIPLEHFVSRNGSVRFPVGNRDIKLITVFAQIPSGARAVSEFEMLAALPSKKKQDIGNEQNEKDGMSGWAEPRNRPSSGSVDRDRHR